jgi:hypothetical protein
MSRQGKPLQLSLIRLGDAAQSWADAGFTVSESPTGGHSFVALGRTRIELTGAGGGFIGWGFRGSTAETGAIDGLAELPTDDPPDSAASAVTGEMVAAGAADAVEAGSAPTHPNGISSIDHVVIDSDDIVRTTSALEASGFVRSGGRTTESYGSPMAQSFFWAGDVILELVGPPPPEPDDRPDTDSRPGGASASIFGLALVADDLDETARFLGELMGSPREAVQPGRRIAGLRGRDLGMAMPIAVMSPHVKGQ